MLARRRPFAALFATLFVWLTAVGSAATTASRERRLLAPTDERVATTSIVVPRATAIAPREVTRAPALSDGPPALPGATVFAPPIVGSVRRDSHATHSRVRQVQGLASTYDATAPPALG